MVERIYENFNNLWYKKGTIETCADKVKWYIKNDVNIINIKENKNIDLNTYRTLIIGSTFYAGMFIKEIKEFIEKN